jgi:hypothetical protein
MKPLDEMTVEELRFGLLRSLGLFCPIDDGLAVFDELARRLAECEKRAFALASNQCHKPIARENGDHGCEYQDADLKA